jgi:hypothetical protein
MGRKIIAAGALALLALLLWGGGAAHGYVGERGLAIADSIAASYDADSGCAGRAEVKWVSQQALDDLKMVDKGEVVTGALGAAHIPSGGECEMWIREDLTGYAACETYVHEYLHLAGWEHSDDPRSPMNVAPGCEAMEAAKLTGREAKAALRATIGASWRMACDWTTWKSGRECKVQRRTARGGRLTQRWTVERSSSGAVVVRRGWKLAAL